MWIFLLIGLGVAIGIALMSLLQISKQADEKMKQMKWRNDE